MPAIKTIKRKVVMSKHGGVFLVFRMPLLILLLLGLLCGLGFAGWRLLFSVPRVDPSAEIRRRMQEKISALESYHARFKTTSAGQGGETLCSVEIWKENPHRFRLEMTTCEEGQPGSVEVIVGDGDGVYLYDRESGEFLPALDPGAAGAAAGSLEDYWRSICEAPCFNYIGEEKASRHSYYLVEIVPAEPHRDRVNERIWLEKKSLLPVRIESFDMAGRLTQVTVFEMLQLNHLFETALFEVDAAAPDGDEEPP